MEWNIPSLKDMERYFWRCTACGTCRSAYEFGPPPTARPICPAGTEFGFEGFYSSKGKAAFARGITDGTLTFDDPEFLEAVYKCTVCGGCQNQCQVDFKPHIPEVIEAMRREAVESGKGPMPLQQNLVQSMKNYNNPYQGPRRVRTDWTRPFKKAKTPIKDINTEPAEVLFYVGCTGAFNKTAMSVPQATARIFQKLGIDFGILGENEVCCGSTAMRVGDANEFKRVATSNLETFNKLHKEKGVKTIVTSCAGCFRAIKKDYILASEYDQLMDGIQVVHTAQFLYQLYKDGKLTFKKQVPWKVTYHDPCHTGRHLNKFIIDHDGSTLWEGAYVDVDDSECLYDIPRELIQAIPGVEFVEMERIRGNSFCCGGGGGVMTGFTDWAGKNAGLRIQEGVDTGADKMISICPFCYFNLTEGTRRVSSKMSLHDLTELIDAALEE
jgi:heterodisulfide reductase subunit D